MDVRRWAPLYGDVAVAFHRQPARAALSAKSTLTDVAEETTLVLNTWRYLGRADIASQPDGSPPTPPVAAGGPR